VEPDFQPERRSRADRIASFRQELAELERAQVLTLTTEQRARVEAHQAAVLAGLGVATTPDASASASAARISWGMRIVSLLGGVAFFAALVLFLHRIWGLLPFAGQAGLLGLLPLLLLGATAWVHGRAGASYYTALLALATGAAFVMGLNVLGVVLGLAPSPQALLAWAALAILVAFAYELRLLLGLGAVLACAYVAALGTEITGRYWLEFMSRPTWMLPAAALLYALPELTRHRQSPAFEFTERMWGAGTCLTALLVLSKSGDLCCSAPLATVAEALYQLAGLGLSAGVIAHGLRLGRSGLVNLGAVAFVVFLFVRLHGWWWDWMPKYLFFLCLGLVALGLLALFRRLRRHLPERTAA
jgi:hypothetical protein